MLLRTSLGVTIYVALTRRLHCNGIQIARKGITAQDDSTLKEIEGLGVTITRLSDAERQAFVDATRGVYANSGTCVEAWQRQDIPGPGR